MLFNIFINDIFPFLQGCDLANYGDDTTICTSDGSIKIPEIPKATSLLFCLNGFAIIVLNSDKYSFVLLGVDDELQTDLMCGNGTFKNGKIEKVVGITVDNRLNFVMYLLNIAKNANCKFNALTGGTQFPTTE